MGLFTREEARQCKKCDFKWFAERVQKPGQVLADLYSLHGQHGMAAAKGSKYHAKMQQYNRWRHCPNCGTKRVKTVSKRGFEPTGMVD